MNSGYKVIIFLCVCLTAFVISTIIVTIEKFNFKSDLNECKRKLENSKETTTTEIPSTTTTVTAPPNKINYRLNNNVKPTHYDLYLHPYLNNENGSFSGIVKISLDIKEDTNFFELHSKGLQIEQISVVLDNNQNIKVNRHEENNVREVLMIFLEKKLSVGVKCKLEIKFQGSMLNRIVGFYRSSYSTTSSKKYIATSKFEPTYARQAFPCFDEPAMKAKFKVTLARPTQDNYIALSNMDEEEQEVIGDNTTLVHFKESVEMSTYVTCFIVCDFKGNSQRINTSGIGDPFDMKVYATSGQIDKLKFALETGVKVTEYYIQYFKIPYPLPKLDMIAIPDFVSGAMEHWGLVTFRETALLYDESISSTVNKQRVGVTVAHELAHMWFGNLVTMKWWDDLWLNEGFATYMSFKGLANVYPSWKLMDQFIVEELHGVLNLDATTASHPIVQKVESPDQITEIFDTITYEKGASIIRMLEDFVTPAIFQKAVQNYLEAFKYSNAITDDLLTKIGELEQNIDVKYIMQTWTEQMGLPVVEVFKVSDLSYKLKQKRFFSNPEDEGKQSNDSPFHYKWYIPITYVQEGDSEVKRIWFNNLDTEVSIDLDKPAKWIKINKDQVGYYRVNYPVDIWKNLADVLRNAPNTLSTMDRAHLLNDVFALADATQLDYSVALDITRYLENESDFVPWSVASSKLITLKGLLMYTNVYKNFVEYFRNLVNTAYNTVGWNVDNDHLKNRFRITILELACSLGHVDCLNEAATKFQEFLKAPEKRPNPDIRSIVYYHGMIMKGNEDVWNQVWELFKTEQDPNEKLKLMRALSGIQVPWILSRFIDLAWDANNVRGQDYFTCLAYIADNPIGENIVWNYVRDNWPKLVDRFGLNERYLGRMIPSITSKFSTKGRLKEMETFFNDYPEAGAGAAARQQALQKVKNNIKWLETNKDKVENWLKEEIKGNRD